MVRVERLDNIKVHSSSEHDCIAVIALTSVVNLPHSSLEKLLDTSFSSTQISAVIGLRFHWQRHTAALLQVCEVSR